MNHIIRVFLGCLFVLPNTNFNLFYHETSNKIWISSEEGWHTYDGIETKLYKTGDEESGLKGNWIQTAMIKDEGGTQWTSTYEYLCQYNEAEDRFNCQQLIIEGDTLTSGYHIIEYNTNTSCLILRIEEKLYSYSTKTEQVNLVAEETLANYFVRYNEDLVVGSPWAKAPGIELWDTQDQNWEYTHITLSKCHPALQLPEVSESLVLGEELYLVTNKGLIHYHFEDPCKSDIYNLEDIKRMKFATVIGNLLLVTTSNDGILVFDYVSNKFVDHLTNDLSSTLALSSNKIEEIFYYEKNIYITFVDADIQILKSWEIKSPTFKSKEKIKAVSIDDDYAAVLLENNNVTLVDLKTKQKKYIQAPYKSKLINLNLDSENKILYLYGNYKLYSYNFKSNNLELITTLDNELWSFEVWRDSLFAVTDINLHVLNQNILHPVASVNNLTNKSVRFVENLNDEYLAIHYESGKTILYDGSISKVISSNNYVNSIVWDQSDSTYLIGTDRGLQHSMNGQVETYPTQVCKLQTEKIESLHSNEHYTLVNAINGAYIKREKQWSRLFDFDSGAKLQVHPYSIDSILLVSDFHIKKVAIKDVLNGEEMKITLNNLEVDSIIINDSQFPSDSKILTGKILSHQLHGLSNSQLLYSIDDQDYQACSNPFNIPISTIAAGGHELKFKVQLNDCSYTNELSYPFTKKQVWYKTFWFLGLLSLSIIGLIVAIMSRRLSILQNKLESERMMNDLEKAALQAQMNPHFIFNSLNSIQNFIMSNEKESAMEYLGKFAQLIRSNLNASVESRITLSQEVKMLTNYLQLEQIRMNNKFEFEIIVDKDIDQQSMMIPSMLIQPFVENAVIHGMRTRKKNGEITVQFDSSDKTINVKIHDNGIGKSECKEKNQQKSYGTSITQKRLAYINNLSQDQVSVKPQYDSNGTTVNIKINRV